MIVLNQAVKPLDRNTYRVLKYIQNMLLLICSGGYCQGDVKETPRICPRDKYPWSSWHEYISGMDLISSKTVLGICGNLSDFLDFSASNEEVECLDISDRKRLTDKEAQEIIKTALHIESGTQIQGMSRGERDAALILLKENGLSIRQIERLTGINRGVILKA